MASSSGPQPLGPACIQCDRMGPDGRFIMVIDDRTVATSVGLRDTLNAYAPGDRSTIRVLREGDAREVLAILADLPLSLANAPIAAFFRDCRLEAV